MKLDPNAPAFPGESTWGFATGLTVRQEFAKAAMQGMLAYDATLNGTDFYADCLRHADGLIAALNKEQA